jgi:hypothetical protein
MVDAFEMKEKVDIHLDLAIVDTMAIINLSMDLSTCYNRRGTN